MLVRLTTAYRARLADTLIGVGTSGGLVPTLARIGNGAAGRPPADAMYAPTQEASLTLTRAPNHEVCAVILVPAGQAEAQCDEVGIFAPDGTLLLHATFASQTVGPGIEAAFEFTFNPEVYDG
ncbi:hypothetical protein Dgeo_3027 (plasmid) [Deinococcus geothermalis DSM 11300]|uniref:Uncharacterized protein n=1 Tax=Deinococcus geothermalis (strain DSM 11300 / CIP 105573 / AG-3a) TaxID=319795 RepID=A8ZRF9_DEIGD|nr:hypothetical protein [Deinococcus geothermalis]ABW35068.1 hypothetical protein Dgeo_3027 [Deinococcus geothermalis DSM 11300]